MPTCGITQTIFGTECIGDSLAKINSNFNRLELAVCELSAAPPPELRVNIQSGDGLSVFVDADENVSEDNFIINANNSVQFIGTNQMNFIPNVGSSYDPSFQIKRIPTLLEDQSFTNFLRFDYVKPNQVKPRVSPFITFETVALGNHPPAVTLYWNSSGDSPFTIYSTNDNSPTNLLFSAYPKTPHCRIETVELEGENSTSCFVGGLYIHKGSGIRYNFSTLSLNTVNGAIGTVGSLSAISGNSDAAVILNSTRRLIGSRNYYAGLNGRVRKIKYFTFNNNKYLAVCGEFTGSTTYGYLGRGFILFNLTTQQKYEFQINGRVFNCMPYANYLFVCGAFNSGNAVNAVGGDLVLPALFRINLNNLSSTDRNTWIDREFNENIKRSFLHVNGRDYTANSTYWIYALAYYNNFLYVGGRQYAFRGGVRPYFNYGISVLNIETGVIVTDWTCVFYNTADAGPFVWKLHVETIYDDFDTTKPLKTVLYAGGRFTNINMVENRFRSVRGKPNTWKRKANIAAFLLQTFDLNGAVQRELSNRPELSDWTVLVNGDVYEILPETRSSASVLYLGGAFTRVNGLKIPYLAAVTKPMGISELGATQLWNMAVNGPVLSITKVLSSSTMNQGIASPKTSLLIAGSFTRVSGNKKNYLARVSCVDQNIATQPLSTVVWKVAGVAVNPGAQLDIIPDNVLVAAVSANPTNNLNVTEFPPISGGFENISKGDLCRFVIARGDSETDYTETYYKSVDLIGVSLDYNTSNIDYTNYVTVTGLSASNASPTIDD